MIDVCKLTALEKDGIWNSGFQVELSVVLKWLRYRILVTSIGHPCF